MAGVSEVTGKLELETKLVLGSPALFLNGKRLNKFPVERPLAKPVLVFSSSGAFIGHGIGANCKETGGCISVEGKRYNSNHDLLWQYE